MEGRAKKTGRKREELMGQGGVKGGEGRTWMDQHIAPNVPRTLAAIGISIENRIDRF